MLVLSRKKGECLVIGEGPGQIVLKVLSLSGHSGEVRLGIDAPISLRVRRGEQVASEIAKSIVGKVPDLPGQKLIDGLVDGLED